MNTENTRKKDRRLFTTAVTAGILASVPGLAAADVVLHPGTVAGAVGLTSASFSSGLVSISTSDGAFYANAQISSGAYSITTEGDQTYDSVSIFLSNDVDGVFEDLYLSFHGAGIAVPTGGTVTRDLTRPGGTVDAHVDVVGGTVTSTQFNAYLDTSSENDAAYVYGSGADTLFSMVASDQVDVSGFATIAVYADDGLTVACTADVSFPVQTLSVAEGGTTTYGNAVVVDPSICATTVLKGLVGIHNVPDGTIQSAATIYANGPASRSVYLDNTASPVPDLSYELDGMARGQYSMYAYLYFTGAHSGEMLGLPNDNPPFADLTNGGIVERDFVFDGGLVNGTSTVTGPAAGFVQFGQQYLYGTYDSTQPNNGPAAGGYTGTNIDVATGNYSAILTPGLWQDQYAFWGFSLTPDGVPTTVYLYDNRHISVPVQGGATYRVPDTNLSVSEGVIVFDVIEPPGSPTIGIDNPQVNAYFTDPVTGDYVSIYGYASETGAATPALHLIGPSGTYSFDAYATVQGTYAKFVSSTISIGTAVNTPIGANVVIVPQDPSGNPMPITLDFQTVTGGGQTSVSVTDVGPAAPPDHSLVGVIDGDQYLNISSNATFTGQIEVCIKYDPVALGLGASQEASLTLQQFTNGAWTVINGVFPGDNGGSAVNTSTHTICGLTGSLGTFGVAGPKVLLVPPTDTCIGASGGPAQLYTDADVCTVTVDDVNQLAGGCSGGGGGLASCTFDGLASEALGLGAHSVAVLGTAADTSTAACTSYVDVADRQAPGVVCPAPATVECAGVSTPLSLSATCTDNCGACTASCAAGPFKLGATLVACNAQDANGNGAGCNTSVTVVDTTPPAITLSASPSVLWPPDHKLHGITLSKGIADACDPSPKVTCTASSSEPDHGLGDGDTANDVQWVKGALLLRAERSGTGPGRVYTITCTTTDASGNQSSAVTRVTVPYAQ